MASVQSGMMAHAAWKWQNIKRLQQTEYTGGVIFVQAHGSFNDAVNCYVI
jgi:hypothetical protein